MYKLYWSPASANMTPHAMLEDIGVPYELIKVDTAKGEHRSPGYLKVNPHAACRRWSMTATKFCTRRPPLPCSWRSAIPRPASHRGSTARTAPLFLQWMAYLTNTVQEALRHWWHSEHFVDGADGQAKVKAKAEQSLGSMFRFIDEQIAKSGPYLCGQTFYVCDYYVAMLAQWTSDMAEPAHANPHANTLIRLVMQRPGYSRMLKAEGIEQPV